MADREQELEAEIARLTAGWLPPEVREQAAKALRDVARKYHYSQDHTIGFEDCYAPGCYDARAALDALKGER